MDITIILIIVIGTVAVLLTTSIILNIRGSIRTETIKKYLKSGKVSSAIKTARILTQKEPENSAGHYLLGQAYYRDNKPELALAEYKIVNRLSNFGKDINEVEFRKSIVQLYRQFHQDEEALKEYLTLIKLEPFNADFYFQAGKLFEARGKTDVATGYYKKALEVNPRFGNGHSALGMVYYRNKQYAESKAEFDKAIKFNPENPEPYFYLGKILKETKDYTGALSAFEKVLRSPELKTKALIERGSCYMAANNIEKAIVELERAVRTIKDETLTDSLYARYFLSICYEKNRMIDKAVEQLEKIHSVKPGFRDVAEKLASGKQLRTDDNLKEFLTCNRENLAKLTKGVIEGVMDLQCNKWNETKWGCEMVAMEKDSEKWRNMRKQPRLIRFYRTTDMIDDNVPRDLQEEMKKQNIIKGMIFSSSNFTSACQLFVENRPIELYGKDKLSALLSKVQL